MLYTKVDVAKQTSYIQDMNWKRKTLSYKILQIIWEEHFKIWNVWQTLSHFDGKGSAVCITFYPVTANTNVWALNCSEREDGHSRLVGCFSLIRIRLYKDILKIYSWKIHLWKSCTYCIEHYSYLHNTFAIKGLRFIFSERITLVLAVFEEEKLNSYKTE